MTKYLLDTNHLSAAIRRISPLRERIQLAHRSGIAFGTCIPVLCELETGIQQTGQAKSYRRRLMNLLEYVRVWPLDPLDARLFGEVYLDLERRGRALSQVDMILAAMAKRMRLALLTADRDFEALPDLRTENWRS